jgi:CRP-like cAMP-binding protein
MPPQRPHPRKTVAAGAVIFREGESGDSAFIVERGRVDIVKQDGGTQRRLGSVEPGGIFGEMALVDDQPRMATAQAAIETVLVVVSSATFRAKIDAVDPFISALLRIFNGNIRQLQNEITELRLNIRQLVSEKEALKAGRAKTDC